MTQMSIPLPFAARRLLVPALAACVLLALTMAALATAARAAAPRGAEVSIMDDQLLLNASEAEIAKEMALFSAMGIDRLRVSAFWNQIAPDALSRKKPGGFDGANSSDPRYAFGPLDRVIAGASKQGIKVMLTISTPAPIWASRDPARDNPVWKPRPAAFGAFTTALVTRYAESVDHWGISNEPNRAAWLQPQADRRGRPISAHLYRGLVQAAYPRIKEGDPDSVALVGELASTGSDDPRGATAHQRPLRFLRAMACRDRANRAVRRGRCKGFRPVPVDAVGHHPYQLLSAPRHRSENRDDAAINDGARLLRTLDRLTRVGALSTPGGQRLDVFYTEFGYQTDPPDPFAGVSLARQRRYLQVAAYLAWRTPRIRGLNQFRLTDGAITGSGPGRFKEFQSGLLFGNRRVKPAFRIFRHPFVITGDRFWGHVRPGGAHTVRVEYRRRPKAKFRLVAQVLTNELGYFSFRLPGRKPGKYRYRYTEPAGTSGVLTVRK
ncbi:hypothetical protein BH20ACT20_BH20ACT20_10910 [soil metagenome]